MLRSRIRVAAALAVAALVLAACGGSDDNTSSGGSSASPAEIKVFAAASLTAAFTKIGEDLTAANGGTKVTFNFAGSQALATPDLKVVLAAPDVPVGKYSQQALEKAGVTVKPVSQEQDVKAVVSKVSLGEADAGIVYTTDVTAGGDKVEGVDIPEDQNVVATYPIATVKASKAPDQAQAFMDYVLSDQGQQVLKSYGFGPPPTS